MTFDPQDDVQCRSGMMAGMDDQRSAEGVEHLQAAARELLLAARSFLTWWRRSSRTANGSPGRQPAVGGPAAGRPGRGDAADLAVQPWEQAGVGR